MPWFLRSGKAMGASRQVVTLGFRQPPLRMFPAADDVPAGRVNKIVINFADPGSITTQFLAKVPGPGRPWMARAGLSPGVRVEGGGPYRQVALLWMTSRHGRMAR